MIRGPDRLVANNRGGQAGLRRHLEGWEVGLVAVMLAALGTALAVPWSVRPRDLPVPRVDENAVTSVRDVDRRRAARIGAALARDYAAPGGSLYDLRALGSAVRDFGRAEAEGDTAKAVSLRRRFAELTRAARALGDQAVLDLRAFEEERWLRALRRFTSTGVSTDDLVELGGRFLATARENGWIDSSRRLVMDESVVAILFKKRWNEVTGLGAPPFALSVDENKSFYRFILDHPPHFDATSASASTPLPSPSPAAEAMCASADRWRLRKIDELSAIDPDYPRALARGVLFARLGDYPAAVESFREHLASGQTRYAVIARNYLQFALEQAGAASSP